MKSIFVKFPDDHSWIQFGRIRLAQHYRIFLFEKKHTNQVFGELFAFGFDNNGHEVIFDKDSDWIKDGFSFYETYNSITPISINHLRN